MPIRPCRRTLLFAGICCLVMAMVSAEEQKPLPKVLIIGDSISIGYMKPLVALMEGEAELTHNAGNAQHTGYGLENLDAWLGDTHWDVIHFNFGLHDLKYVNDNGKNVASAQEGHIQIPLEQYRVNLEKIVARLKATGARLVFATTTPYPENLKGAVRKVEDYPKYNAVALEIMKKNGIPVNDLCAFAKPRLRNLQIPQNVHFTDEGSKVLAKRVARQIRKALKSGHA